MDPSPSSALPPGTPPAEVVVDEALVRALLAAQHPDLAALPVRVAASGWDNVMVRLGDWLCVRVPRRAAGAALIEAEQRWLPTLAGDLPIPTTAPVRTGAPGCGYPWRWSVTPWFAGECVDLSGLQPGESAALIGFLEALHRPAPDDAPDTPYRHGPMARFEPAVRLRLKRLRPKTSLLSARLEALWALAVEAPMDTPATWIHGNLHGRNVLGRAGRIAAVIDWGDMGRGDPATDLAAIWMLLPSVASREDALRRYPDASELLWRRARGWAFFFGVMLLHAGVADDPRLARAGEATLRALGEGP